MFGLSDSASGTEGIVVLAETDVTDLETKEKLRTLARQATVDAVGVAPDDIVLVRPGTIPKTQSGKVRRAAARDLYLSRRLNVQGTALNWQLVRLSLLSLPAWIGRFVRTIAEITYAVWWWAVLAVNALAGISAILILPKLSWRWSAVRSLAKFTLAAVGAAPRAQGRSRLPRQGAILMFNHASYVDALVLGAILPGEPVYLAKKEFASQFLVGTLLRRLGVLFVDRYDLAASLADIATAIAAVGRDRLLVIFPEGTFTQRTGLSGFYLGGFKIAAEAGLPVIPGTLRGTRSMLRSDQWLPRHTEIHFEITEPVQSTGKDFAAVLRLRDAVRQAILARCGEPDFNELVKPTPPVTGAAA